MTEHYEFEDLADELLERLKDFSPALSIAPGDDDDQVEVSITMSRTPAPSPAVGVGRRRRLVSSRSREAPRTGSDRR